MPSLKDVSNNLICINGMQSLDALNKGVSTYTKINRIYTQYCSSNKYATTPSYSLTDISFSNGNGGSNYTDSCPDLQNILAKCDNNIATSALLQEASINDKYKLYMDTYKNQLHDNYDKVLEYRTKLDQNAMKIMGLDNSLYEKQNIIDSAIFTTLLWTALATSVLYYTFTKL